MPENKNPAKIKPGENCYALYLPAYTPAAMLSPIPMSKKILRGKAMPDYDDHPADPGAGQPVAYFMPCEPFENTTLDSDIYRIKNWRLFTSEIEAKLAQVTLAKTAIRAYESEIAALRVLS